jgi:hypothetical protein
MLKLVNLKIIQDGQSVLVPYSYEGHRGALSNVFKG